MLSSKLELLFKISKADAVLSRKLGGHGLGLADLAVLYYINQTPDGKIRRSDLAQQVGLTASGVTRLLLPLEKIGVIKRLANEHDARVSFTVLTKPGKEMLKDSLHWLELKSSDLLPGQQDKKIEAALEILEILSK